MAHIPSEELIDCKRWLERIKKKYVQDFEYDTSHLNVPFLKFIIYMYHVYMSENGAKI